MLRKIDLLRGYCQTACGCWVASRQAVVKPCSVQPSRAGNRLGCDLNLWPLACTFPLFRACDCTKYLADHKEFYPSANKGVFGLSRGTGHGAHARPRQVLNPPSRRCAGRRPFRWPSTRRPPNSSSPASTPSGQPPCQPASHPTIPRVSTHPCHCRCGGSGRASRCAAGPDPGTNPQPGLASSLSAGHSIGSSFNDDGDKGGGDGSASLNSWKASSGRLMIGGREGDAGQGASDATDLPASIAGLECEGSATSAQAGADGSASAAAVAIDWPRGGGGAR